MSSFLFPAARVAALSSSFFVLASLAGAGEAARAAKNIPEVAREAGFSTLLTLVEKAGLAEALAGDGPFTVFAPTDEAFARLPAAEVERLTSREGLADLKRILTYHVVPGALDAAAVTAAPGLETLSGLWLDVDTSGRGAKAGGVTIVKTDMKASNGIVHVVDAVILPPSQDLVGMARDAGSCSTLLELAAAADLAGTLGDGGPFTLFAPTDRAFAALDPQVVADLKRPENKDRLAAILKYHIVAGNVFSNDLGARVEARTLAGAALVIVKSGKGVKAGDSSVTQADLQAANGVIHVIDAVLLPPAP